jgi:tetraacyldisaccharide 4'-kinase
VGRDPLGEAGSGFQCRGKLRQARQGMRRDDGTCGQRIQCAGQAVKTRLQAWLEARWYGGAAAPAWLRGLSRLYGWMAQRRSVSARSQRQQLPVPVVVVGNISVGGTGKTPVVIALVEALRAAGRVPGIISRGYGGSERGPAVLPVDADPRRFGDEPVLIALRTGAPVAVGRDRPEAGRCLLARHPEVDVLVSDDGLQHHRLARDIEIVVVDGQRRFGNGLLLPAGPLREPLTRLRDVDVVLVNGGGEDGEWGFVLQADQAVSLVDGAARALTAFAGQRVHAVAGIGNPERFFATLRSAGIEPIGHAFADHHHYRPDELDFGDDLPVLMTEKDAVKCRAFARSNWFAVPVTTVLPTAVIELVVHGLRGKGGRSPQSRA